MPIYIEHLIHELLEKHGGKLISVMEPEIRAIIQAAIDQAAQIAHGRAVEWDDVKAAHDGDAVADARWHEACDIAALIRGLDTP